MEMRMNKIHEIQSVEFKDGVLHLTVDGQSVSRNIEDVSPQLAVASESARNNFKLSPSGYGIHWPDCDEDLSVDALMGIQHKAPMIAAEQPEEYRTKTN
jgi:hypothetical protein